jgi:hypothetical protein
MSDDIKYIRVSVNYVKSSQARKQIFEKMIEALTQENTQYTH